MKGVKITLGIIIALSVVFFATGLIVKEVVYTSQVKVNKPITEVFEAFNNEENLQKWIPEFKSIEPIKKNLGVIGSTYKIIVDNQGQEITLKEKVLAFVKNEKVTLYFQGGGMLKTDDYQFTSQGNETTITLKAVCKSETFILGCMFPYIKGKLKAQDQQYLDNFKEFIEK